MPRVAVDDLPACSSRFRIGTAHGYLPRTGSFSLAPTHSDFDLHRWAPSDGMSRPASRSTCDISAHPSAFFAPHSRSHALCWRIRIKGGEDRTQGIVRPTKYAPSKMEKGKLRVITVGSHRWPKQIRAWMALVVGIVPNGTRPVLSGLKSCTVIPC